MESNDEVVINVVVDGTEDKGDVNASNSRADSAQRHGYFDDNISNEAKELETYVNGKVSMRNKGYRGALSIYRVTEKHRNKNQDAYTPRIVSIGPLHRDKGHLQAMEEHKLSYLDHFLPFFGLTTAQLAKYVHKWEMIVRGFYRDIDIRDQAKLLQAMLLDGVFVVELFLKNYFPEMREEGDTIFENRWVSNDVLHDLLLLENQLPMVFLYALYYAFVYKEVRKLVVDSPSFNELAHEYFKDVCNTRNLGLDPILQPPDFNERACKTFDVYNSSKLEWIPGVKLPRHLVEVLTILHKPSSDRQGVEKPKPEFDRCSTATELQSAGVKFRQGPEKCIFDVSFKDGVLSIPQLVIDNFTETFFRNSIAFEQSGYHPKNITSYVILLDNLIGTHKDVYLLIKEKIIDNQLGSPQQVADVFKNLHKEFVADLDEFYFAKLCSELNDYRPDWRHKLKCRYVKWKLRRDYFGTWVTGGFVLLVLTVIQTLVSVVQFSLQFKR